MAKHSMYKLLSNATTRYALIHSSQVNAVSRISKVKKQTKVSFNYHARYYQCLDHKQSNTFPPKHLSPNIWQVETIIHFNFILT